MSDKKHDVNAVTTESNVEDQDYIYTPVPQNKRYGWIKMLVMLECSSRRPGYRYGVRIQHEVSGCSYCPVNRRYYISGGHDYDCVYRFKNRIGSNVIDSVYRRSGRNLYFLGDYLCDLSGLVCHPVGLLWADLVSVYSDKRTDPGSAGRNYDGIYSD